MVSLIVRDTILYGRRRRLCWLSHVGRLALKVGRISVILGHRLVLDLILWRRTSHIVIVIVVQIASTCEVGRALVLMRATILGNVSAALSIGRA